MLCARRLKLSKRGAEGTPFQWKTCLCGHRSAPYFLHLSLARRSISDHLSLTRALFAFVFAVHFALDFRFVEASSIGVHSSSDSTSNTSLSSSSPKPARRNSSELKPPSSCKVSSCPPAALCLRAISTLSSFM